jgi:hypothetical protein
MAECERTRASGNQCRIRCSFVAVNADDIPENWGRVDGVLTCNICLRELEGAEEETRETRRL